MIHYVRLSLFILLLITAAHASLSAETERDPFAIGTELVRILRDTGKAEENASRGSSSLSATPGLLNGFPQISLQAVSFTRHKKSALIKIKNGAAWFVHEGDRLSLIEGGDYIELNVLEIKPRSILIKLEPEGQLIEVQ